MILRRVTDAFRRQDWFTVFVETMIVVLGVFLGLQVNNWNEARALREREAVYLEQLLIDLESDRLTGARGVASANTIDTAAENLLAVLEGADGAEKVSDGELMQIVVSAGYAYLPQGNSTTYNEMISTGALGLLESVELKRAFGEYYARLAAGRQWDGLLREEQYAYRAAIRGLLTREQFAWARAHAALTPENLPPPPDFDRAEFLEDARRRPEIINSLRSMGAVQQRLRDDSRDMADRAETLAARVKAELE